MTKSRRYDPSRGDASVSRMPKNPDTQLREADDHRLTLHRSSLAFVEDSAVSSMRSPSGYEAHYQIVLPYYGLFAYNAGRKRWLIDPNRILFIAPGWEFRDEHPVAGMGHAAILLNPSRNVLDEVCGHAGASRHRAFDEGSRPSDLRLMLLTQQMLHMQADANDGLKNDEWTVYALRAAFGTSETKAARASRVVDRAKEVLHARSCERLCLDEVAQEVGVSPVYLTQEFTRTEGLPLYRYQLRLRLSRALLELPHCGDITGLALDLGFSSHSHFTAAFREAFGLTPSDYRTTIGTRQSRVAILSAFEARQRANCKAA